MLYNAQNGTIKLENAEIDYVCYGTGEKILIMLPGLGDALRSIKGTALPFALAYHKHSADYKVYMFSRKHPIEEGYSIRDMARDQAEAMKALGISKADIVGVSQGGMIAQYLAIDRPDLVNKMVLAVTLSQNNETVEAVVRNWIMLTEQGRMKALIADMAEKMYSEQYVKRYKPFLPLLTIFQKPKDVQRFIRLAKACLTCSTYEELEKIKCPVLVVGGREDKIVGGEASEEIASKLGCKLYMYEHLGHAAYEEAKNFNQRIYEFLREDN